MIYYAAQLADKMTDALTRGDQAAFEDYDDKLGFYTPILRFLDRAWPRSC